MNFKGSSFSLGSGSYVSGIFKDGVCRLYIRRGGAVSCLEFNKEAKTIKTLQAAASYAESCFETDFGLIEYEGGKLAYEES